MTQRLDPETIDLAQLTDRLARTMPRPIEGHVEGRTQFRDAAQHLLDCSQLEAEELIDTLVARGFVWPERREDGLIVWRMRVE